MKSILGLQIPIGKMQHGYGIFYEFHPPLHLTANYLTQAGGHYQQLEDK